MEGSVYPVPAVGGTWSRCCHLVQMLPPEGQRSDDTLPLPHISGVLVPPSGPGFGRASLWEDFPDPQA